LTDVILAERAKFRSQRRSAYRLMNYLQIPVIQLRFGDRPFKLQVKWS